MANRRKPKMLCERHFCRLTRDCSRARCRANVLAALKIGAEPQQARLSDCDDIGLRMTGKVKSLQILGRA
jgi:hypothetical protein